MTLDFGQLSADGDPYILNYFHVTRQAGEIVDPARPFARCIFIGRQGSGKTAMTTWLASQATNTTTVLIIKPESHRILIEGKEPNKTDIRFMAKIELMVAIGQLLVNGKRLTGTLLQTAKRLCFDGWKAALGNAVDRVGAGSAFGFGFTLKTAERDNYLRAG
jgi:hypothetical protein